LVMNLLLVSALIRLWKLQFDHSDEIDRAEPQPVLPAALAIGAMSRAVGCWLFDHDVWSIRTNWRRRLLFTFRWSVQKRFIQRYTSKPDALQYNFSIGTAVGTIGYRLWYGLLHPLPGEDNETSS